MHEMKQSMNCYKLKIPGNFDKSKKKEKQDLYQI